MTHYENKDYYLYYIAHKILRETDIPLRFVIMKLLFIFIINV